jgi:dihydrodipicolinate synthase/N-acetylneuraminate lyase
MGVLEGIIVPTLTPMSEKGDALNLEGVAPQVEELVRHGVNALFLGGTTGEGTLLDASERKAYAEEVLGAAAGRLPVAVQVGAVTTRESVALAEHAAQNGASAVACLTPYYVDASPRAIEQHIRAVARTVSPLSVYLYNIPSRTGNPISPDLAERLSNEPNIVGIKDSTGDMAHLLELLSVPDFDVVIGADLLAVPALQAGAVGLVSGPAGVFPELYVAFWRAWKRQAYDAALQLQEVILHVSRRVHHGARIDLLKALAEHRWGGMGSVRPPLLPPPREELTALCRELKEVLARSTLPSETYRWLAS